MRHAIPAIVGVDLANCNALIHPRIIWQGGVNGYGCETIFFFGEADVAVTGVMLHPNGSAVQIDIVLLENGTNDIPFLQERLQALLGAYHRLFVFDVRGTGGVQTRQVNDHLRPHDTEYKLSCDAMMLSRCTPHEVGSPADQLKNAVISTLTQSMGSTAMRIITSPSLFNWQNFCTTLGPMSPLTNIFSFVIGAKRYLNRMCISTH
jgi:hypothetical protein